MVRSDRKGSRMSKKHFTLYCMIIACVFCAPILFTSINIGAKVIVHQKLLEEAPLSGAFDIPSRPKLTLNAILSRQFQTDLEKYIEYHMTTRKFLTRVYNQLLYTAFHSSDSKAVMIGRNDYLFETNYPEAYFSELTDLEKIQIQNNISKLILLNDLLAKRGITLVVRMSPSKAEYYTEFLPRPYDRFAQMKRTHQYGENWYQVFTRTIRSTDLLYYDRHDEMQDLKHDGKILFTKGGTHWSLLPMADYINGLNALLEQSLDKKLGRIEAVRNDVITGKMGTPDDSDIWNICWNALSVPPEYPSPNMTFQTIPGESTVRVFTIGQSFTWGLLNTIYAAKDPVWSETYFSYYNGRVLHFDAETPHGVQISDKTEDYAQYLQTDVFLIELLECGTGENQFEFVDHMLQYLLTNGAEP
jgi:hypothetical protein